MVKILAVAGAAVILLAGVGVVLFESAAASARDAQTTASALLKKVDSDTKLIDSTFQAPKLPDLMGQTTSHPDFKGSKRTLDEYVMRIDHTTSFVAPDLVELRSTEAQLRGQSGNPLAFPSRSALDQLRRRVASMRSALTEADAAMAVERDQAHTLSALMDAFDDMATMFDRIGHSDVLGGVAMFSGLDTKLQTVDQLAYSSNNPIQLELGISNLRRVLGDFQSYLQAAERNDSKTIKALDAKISSESKALDNLNPPSLDPYERALVQPHIDLYHMHLKAAGFAPATSGGSTT
jgi:hypothetical protein